MWIFKTTCLCLLALLFQNCEVKSQLEIENQELRDSISILNESLHQCKNVYHFKTVFPLIVPTDCKAIEGEESVYNLFIAGENFFWRDKPVHLTYELSSSLKSDLHLQSIDGFENLYYRPIKSGSDTIRVNFVFLDHDSVQIFQLPSELFLEVEKNE